MVQCHLCQTGAHYDCVGENEADIVGIWACRTCRALPTTVTGVLRIVTTLQTTITDLCTLVGQQKQEIRGLRDVVVAESGRQLADLVTMVAEQRQEICSLREEIVAAGRRQYAEVCRANRPGKTLVVGNSLLRDVKVDVTTYGYPVKVSEQFAVLLCLIRRSHRQGVEKETLKEVVIVGGTREVTDKVPVERIREQLTVLVTKAKAKTPAVTVSSVLPVLNRADAEFVAEVNRQMRTTCDELNVKFVDNDANFAFKDGTVDRDVYHKDGLHLSGRGVSKLVSNLGLVEKRGKQTTKNPTTSLQQQKATITVNRDRQPARSDGDCEVKRNKHSSSRQPHTPGQCAKCGETNHVTINCWHSRKVECRQCRQL